jgi:hypothetical protein
MTDAERSRDGVPGGRARTAAAQPSPDRQGRLGDHRWRSHAESREACGRDRVLPKAASWVALVSGSTQGGEDREGAVGDPNRTRSATGHIAGATEIFSARLHPVSLGSSPLDRTCTAEGNENDAVDFVPFQIRRDGLRPSAWLVGEEIRARRSTLHNSLHNNQGGRKIIEGE